MVAAETSASKSWLEKRLQNSLLPILADDITYRVLSWKVLSVAACLLIMHLSLCQGHTRPERRYCIMFKQRFLGNVHVEETTPSPGNPLQHPSQGHIQPAQLPLRQPFADAPDCYIFCRAIDKQPTEPTTYSTSSKSTLYQISELTEHCPPDEDRHARSRHGQIA